MKIFLKVMHTTNLFSYTLLIWIFVISFPFLNKNTLYCVRLEIANKLKFVKLVLVHLVCLKLQCKCNDMLICVYDEAASNISTPNISTTTMIAGDWWWWVKLYNKIMLYSIVFLLSLISLRHIHLSIITDI